MSKIMSYAVFIVCALLGAMGYITASVARMKNRDSVFWFIMGVLFGLLAIGVVALLPKKPAPKKASRRVPKKATVSGTTEVHSEASIPFDEGIPEFPLTPRLRIPTSKDIKWYYLDAQAQQIGPVKINDLRKQVLEKQVDGETYVWHSELSAWTQLKDFTNSALLFDPDFLEE